MNKQVLLGSLMGDSNVYKSKKGYYIFSIEHSIKQEEYLKWKSQFLGINNIYYRNRLDKRTNKIYSSIILSKGSPIFKEFYELFYNPKKEVNKEILDLLDPLSIDVWYMDDGSLYCKDINHLELAINGFNKESRKLIVEWFKDKFEINFKFCRKSIRLTSKKEIKKFMNIIEPYIINSMNYKLLK